VDQAFFLRAKRLLERRPALSHHELLARLADDRAASPTVQASTQSAPALHDGGDPEALAALLLAEPGWRIAARIQRGCFNRASAIRLVNTP
jgi:hypothetical protein